MVVSKADRDKAKRRRLLTRQVEAGRVGLEKALAALKTTDPAEFPAYMVPKLMETASAVTLAALAALRELDAEERPESDPWERIAAALDPANSPSVDSVWGPRSSDSL